MVTVRPKHPPGQRSRKARRYGEQIRKLQAEGYTLHDIREALVEAGVMVSKSTVQREASRSAQSPLPSEQPTRQPPPTPQVGDGLTNAPHWTAAASPAQDKQSGKDVAAAYFAENNFNPLFRKDER